MKIWDVQYTWRGNNRYETITVAAPNIDAALVRARRIERKRPSDFQERPKPFVSAVELTNETD